MKLWPCCIIAISLFLAGCDNGEKERQEIMKSLDDQNKVLDAQILANAMVHIEMVRGAAARAHAELDLMNGGSVYQIKKAQCQSSVFVDGHPAGAVTGCAKHTRYGQTTVDESDFIFSLPPKQDGGAYTITIKKNGYKNFQTDVKPQEKHGYVTLDAVMEKS